VQAWKGDHVDGELSQVGVKLAWESQASGDAAQGRADQMIEVAVGRRGQLEGPETNIVERLVVYAVRLVRVLHQLVHRERAVVRLDHGVRYLRKQAGVRRRREMHAMHTSTRIRVARDRARCMHAESYALYASRNVRRYCPIKDKRWFLAGALFRVYCTLSRAHRKDFCAASPRNTAPGDSRYAEIRGVTSAAKSDLALFPKATRDFIGKCTYRM